MRNIYGIQRAHVASTEELTIEMYTYSSEEKMNAAFESIIKDIQSLVSSLYDVNLAVAAKPDPVTKVYCGDDVLYRENDNMVYLYEHEGDNREISVKKTIIPIRDEEDENVIWKMFIEKKEV